MSKTFERAEEHTIELMGRMLHEHHRDLAKAGVTVDVLMCADIDELSGELCRALKQQGYVAAATIKVTTLAQRALGCGDALLTIDQASWNELGEASRLALLDHELEHLALIPQEGGSWKRDDQKRPKLRLRLHDVQIGAFRAVAARHGAASLEVQAIRASRDEAGQYFWDFAANLRAVGT